MISRLVRTELESYLHDTVVWGGTIFFVIAVVLSFMGLVNARSGESLSDYLSDLFLLSVILSSVLVAVKVSQRNAVEKRTRLFAQLPVSTREVSVASWWVRLLCLLVPTLAITVFLARAANLPFPALPLISLAIYLGGTTLVGAICVAMNIPHLPPPLSAWARGVFFSCVIVALAIWFLGNMLVMPPVRHSAIWSLVDVGLSGLTFYLMVSAVGVVVVDIWLRDRLDDYLE